MIELRHDGDGWGGTFVVAVHTIAEGLLGDGEPVDDVTVDLDNGSTVHGQLTALNKDDGTLIIGHQAVEVEDLRRLHVD